MAAPSDRIILRLLPLALALTVAVATALLFVTRPFGSQEWPQPTRAPAIERVVDVPQPPPAG